MKSSARTFAFAIGAVLVGALAGSALTTMAESQDWHPAGSYRATLSSRALNLQLPFNVTFNSDGTLVASVIPISCGPAATFAPGHGAWRVTLGRGGPVAHFVLVSDYYSSDSVLPRHEGTMRIAGTAGLRGEGVRGTAHIAYAGACANVNETVEFTAEKIRVHSPDPDVEKG